MGNKDKIAKKLRSLQRWSHPPVDWEAKINTLAKKVNKLSKLISKGVNNAK